jgi:hypothetical protein
VNLRGNVDSRLRRLHEPRGTDRQLDGVVLAMAGLSRLFADTATERQGRQLLTGLLEGLNVMVLPLTDSPGAPGQGALAIECRADDTDTRQLLASLEDQATRGAIAIERALLAEHGGGCHQRFGATLTWLPQLGGLLQIAGRNAQDKDLAERRFLPDAALPEHVGAVHAWDGSQAERATSTPLLDAAALAGKLRGEAVFVAHSRALPAHAGATLADRKVWTSGVKSWFALAAEGVWVQGCGEGLGAEATAQLIVEPLLRLPAPQHWDVLTHAAAVEPWQDGSWAGANVLATYAVSDADLPDPQALAAATHIYWSSTAQFERGHRHAASRAWHASGPGKTAEHIRAAGVRNFRAFPSVEEWRKWTRAKAP